MKIGFAIGTLRYSGAEKIARLLIEALHHQYGHEIGLILISGEGPYEEFPYVKQFPIKTAGNRYTRTWKRQKMIRDIVKKEKYDVVVSFGVKFNLDVMEALQFTGTKVILCERNDPVSDPHRKVLRLRRRLCYPAAKAFVFQTQRIAAFFGKAIAKRSAIIPNFIENKLPMLYREDAPNRVVLTARLDDRQKNISMLLRAFERFSQDNDYQLYIVGDGPDEGKFKQYVADHNLGEKVIFTGRQNVYDYLKDAQIYVLPSNYEGMPNSLIEALASGLPCIATDCSGGGAAYLIENGVNGTLIPVDDEDALVQALQTLAGDPDLRKAYSEAAYKLNERLEFNKIMTAWVDFIQSVAKA